MLPNAQPKPVSRAAQKQQQDRADERAWLTVRRQVLLRDGFACRRCKSRDKVDAHHIKFRSAGGEDTPENVAALCRCCHAEVHSYRLAVSGNANRALHFEVLK